MHDTLRGITANTDPTFPAQADSLVLLAGILIACAVFAAIAVLIYLTTRISASPTRRTRPTTSSRKSPRVTR